MTKIRSYEFLRDEINIFHGILEEISGDAVESWRKAEKILGLLFLFDD